MAGSCRSRWPSLGGHAACDTGGRGPSRSGGRSAPPGLLAALSWHQPWEAAAPGLAETSLGAGRCHQVAFAQNSRTLSVKAKCAQQGTRPQSGQGPRSGEAPPAVGARLAARAHGSRSCKGRFLVATCPVGHVPPGPLTDWDTGSWARSWAGLRDLSPAGPPPARAGALPDVRLPGDQATLAEERHPAPPGPLCGLPSSGSCRLRPGSSCGGPGGRHMCPQDSAWPPGRRKAARPKARHCGS